MRTFDFSPLYRSAIGFDRLASVLDAANRAEQQPSFPPYNIEREDENAYRITMAVAGFNRDDLTIEQEQNTLTITGKQADRDDNEREFLYRGIAQRNFERRFQLADHVKVVRADMENGLLHVELVREIPEAMKPRQIEIGGGSKARIVDAKKKDEQAA